MPRYNFEHDKAAVNARKNLEYHIKKKNTIEQKFIRKTRSSAENRALHLYYKNVADCLVEIGYNHKYINHITGEIIEMPFTKDLFKDEIWRKLQIEMFKIESTTGLTNPMINDILEVLGMWLGEKGILVKFPNRIDLLIEQMDKNNLN